MPTVALMAGGSVGSNSSDLGNDPLRVTDRNRWPRLPGRRVPAPRRRKGHHRTGTGGCLRLAQSNLATVWSRWLRRRPLDRRRPDRRDVRCRGSATRGRTDSADRYMMSSEQRRARFGPARITLSTCPTSRGSRCPRHPGGGVWTVIYRCPRCHAASIRFNRSATRRVRSLSVQYWVWDTGVQPMNGFPTSIGMSLVTTFP